MTPDAKFYTDPETFACISHPAVRIPTSRVNDDYCDCPDGSDEPGTSACAHLAASLPHAGAPFIDDGVEKKKKGADAAVLPGFYCENGGHRPAFVPFTHVNDGICDYELCCDGSEEWAGVGGVRCADRCGEMGAAWRTADAARRRSRGNAARLRREMVAEAGRLRLQVADRIQTLGTELEGAEKKVQQLTRELGEVERAERGKMVRAPREGAAPGKVGVLATLARDRIEDFRAQLERVKGERDRARAQLQETEGILRTFKDEYNPNFNDEGVKRAVRAWEDYAAKEVAAPEAAARDRDLEEMLREGFEGAIDWADFEGDEQGGDTDVCEWGANTAIFGNSDG